MNSISKDMWTSFNNILKRIGDILLSLLALLVLSPVMVICAIWVKLDSKGPVIFRQDRLTKNGKVFKMMKFRSMVQDAEKQGTGLFNYEDDPRVTRSGRFLRDHSLDELPQLINILKGDMSIVGNRPLPLYEAEKLTMDNCIDRFMAPAGLTGLGQVEERGRGGVMSAKERKMLDIKYGKTFSFMGDMKIILRTLTAFVQKENV